MRSLSLTPGPSSDCVSLPVSRAPLPPGCGYPSHQTVPHQAVVRTTLASPREGRSAVIVITARWATASGSSPARRVAIGRAAPGSARPCDRQLPAMIPSTRSSAPGSPWGSQSGVKGDGRARTKDIPARIRGAGGHPACWGICQEGSGQPGNLRACRGWPIAGAGWSLPKPEGSHQEHQRLASGLEPLEQAARCTRAG